MARLKALSRSSSSGGGWDGSVRNTAFVVATVIVLAGRIATHLHVPLRTHHVDRGGELLLTQTKEEKYFAH